MPWPPPLHLALPAAWDKTKKFIQGRPLSDEERGTVDNLFGNTVDMNKVSIHQLPPVGLFEDTGFGGVSPVVFPNEIFLSQGMKTASPEDQHRTLVHEMTHVAQAHRDSPYWLMTNGLAKRSYNYGTVDDLEDAMNAGRKLNDYNAEQQASMAEDYDNFQSKGMTNPEMDQTYHYFLDQLLTPRPKPTLQPSHTPRPFPPLAKSH